MKKGHCAVAAALLPCLLGIGSWGDVDIPPYLTNATTVGITVGWSTATPSTTRVEYGDSPDSMTNVIESSDLVSFHEVVIDDLEPNGTYYYKVISRSGSGSDVVNTQPKTFPTARASGEGFRFAFFGETHSNGSFRQVSQADFAATVNDFAPHLMLNAGDHVDDGEDLAQWQQFFSEAGAMIDHIPLMNAWGNHDDADGAGAADNEVATLLFDHPGNERYYAYQYANTLFIALDMMWQYDGRSPEAIDWLESVLAAASDGAGDPSFIVAFFHPPVYGANKYAGSCAESPESTDWIKANLQPLFEQYRVSLVLGGHEMLYARAEVNGVTYVQVTSSDKLRTVDCEAPELSVVAMKPSFLRASVDCDTLTAEGYLLDGVTVDDQWLFTTGEGVEDTFTIPARPDTDCAFDPEEPTAGPDAGVDEPGTPPPGGDDDDVPEPEAGCGCRTGSPAGSGAAALAVALLAFRRRRR